MKQCSTSRTCGSGVPTSLVTLACFMRTASSTAISQKGLIDILMFSITTAASQQHPHNATRRRKYIQLLDAHWFAPSKRYKARSALPPQGMWCRREPHSGAADAPLFATRTFCW